MSLPSEDSKKRIHHFKNTSLLLRWSESLGKQRKRGKPRRRLGAPHLAIRRSPVRTRAVAARNRAEGGLGAGRPWLAALAWGPRDAAAAQNYLLWLGLLLVRFSRELNDISRARKLCGRHLLEE
ncbi:hypothetical protein Cadr_000015677 [Camelus dromedarius]|uniref:Uncharacterized protein n=1 Tax=Camelus dromedarius TaxID=9838 RepID=A0A5N4E9S7_CAMDR|nr:hypothetical protein Cadr_000015677 [Camelus dromedarius]